jgi:dolichol-phosphate mannosyltransferase
VSAVGRGTLARPLWRAGWLGARLVAGAVAAARLAGAARSRPPLELDPSPLAEDSVTVVVPARDEAQRIGPLLESLGRDPTPRRLVVVDDESSDGTAAVARAAGAEVVSGAPVPRGWVGKPWALQQGLAAATTPWVVTLDADTVPGPGLLAALVRRCQSDGWDLLSVGARFRCDGRLQQLVHASMLATLVYRFGPPGSLRPAAPPRTMANGQCTVFRREALLAVGGFAAAAPHLTDDVALARHLAALGWRVGFLDGTRAIDVRMHDSLAETWRDWGRSLPMPDVTSPGRQIGDLAVVVLVQALPLARLVIGRGDVVDVVLLLLRVGTLMGTRRAYRRPGPGFWLSPLADLPVAARLVQGAVRPDRTWRGRIYRRTPA